MTPSPKTYRVEIRRTAKAALRTQAKHIEQNSGPERAVAWLREMLLSIDKLETLPRRFRPCGVWKGYDVRSQTVMSHLTYYIINDEAALVSIIDIAGGGQQRIRERYEAD